MLSYEMSGTITNGCICEYCPDCGVVYQNNELTGVCPDCGKKNEQSFTGCDGECWSDSKEWLAEALGKWCEAVDCEFFAVYGTGMGWTGAAGHTGKLESVDDLLDNLGIRSEWRIEWNLDEGNTQFTLRRWSHDEPMGSAKFRLEPWEEGDDE